MGEYRHDLQFARKALAEAEGVLLQLSQGSQVTRVQNKRIHELLWRSPDGDHSVLVRAERRFTGNFFLETKANNTTQRPGWMLDSSANFLLYGFCNFDADLPHVWYLLDLTELRKLVSVRTKSIDEANRAERVGPPLRGWSALRWVLQVANSKKTSDTFRDGKLRYHSNGLLLPIDDAKQAGAVLHLVEVPCRGE